MKTREPPIFEHAQEDPNFPDIQHDSAFISDLDLFSPIITESIYVIDVAKNRLDWVQPNDLFLCGYSVEDALHLGYDFYKKVIHPDDLPLWERMRKVVLRYFTDFEENREDVDSFSCTFRLQRKYAFNSHPLSQMVSHRMKPVWAGEELRYFICSVTTSYFKKAGNLCLFYKDGVTCKEYNTKTQRWKRKQIEPLTERESAILMLARQGETTEEIADHLCKGRNTIRNQIKSLFNKLHVHSMQEALDYIDYYPVVDHPRGTHPQTGDEAICKKRRVAITAEQMQHIQQHLDDGKSIRQAAKLEHTEESAIRYWIKKGNIKVIKKKKS